MDHKLLDAVAAYQAVVQEDPPHIFNVEEAFFITVLEEHTNKGEPIPEDFDWYPNVPEDADV